ncbi:MAG: aromatic ring-hydroxylating oxygenase subunit alpha, partial [Actinomycetota bacterium]
MPDTDPLGPPPWPTLPGADYHAPAVFNVERERIFARTWICVGRGEDLPEPGDYRVTEVAGEQVIVIRGDDGELRAFADTCRHRGTLLLEGEGRVHGAIKCPYHAWTYGFDGRLLGTPNVHREDGIDRETMGLWKVRLEEWDGFAFVN